MTRSLRFARPLTPSHASGDRFYSDEKRSGLVLESEKQAGRQRWTDLRKRVDAKPRNQPAPIGKKVPVEKSLCRSLSDIALSASM